MTLSFNIQAASDNNYHPSLNTLHFDRNGKPLSPRAPVKPFRALVGPLHFDKYGRVHTPRVSSTQSVVRYEHRGGIPWTTHMCTPDRVEWNTDQAKQLNGLHYQFLRKGTSLEQYTDRIIGYLGGAEQDVLDFIHSISSKLESGSFCPLESRDRFAKCLSRSWRSYRNRQVLGPKIARKKRVCSSAAPIPLKAKPLAQRVEEFYTGYKAGDVSEFDFLTVCRTFAFIRVRSKFKGIDHLGQTPEDITQDAMKDMWRSLNKVDLAKGSFYSWFGGSIANTVKDAKQKTMKDAMTRGSLYRIQNDGKAGETAEGGTSSWPEENPVIYGGIKVLHNGRKTYQEPRLQTQRELPKFIQDTDLKICMYIRADKTYSQIADLLETTEKAVERRIFRMRKTIEEIKGSSA